MGICPQQRRMTTKDERDKQRRKQEREKEMNKKKRKESSQIPQK